MGSYGRNANRKFIQPISKTNKIAEALARLVSTGGAPALRLKEGMLT